MADARAILRDLYARHAPAVHRRALRLLGSEADAHEVLQDLFVSLLARPDELAGRSAWSSYLYTATTHACLNRLRNQRRRERLLEREAAVGQEHASEPEQLVLLRAALARLPEELATVAVYYALDGLTQQEIAQILGCSRRHVGHLLERLEA
ncbi:MAG TPA: sigma-70 family RNA polymerase sigma factor, partial [Polyangiales bacterium]